MTTVGAGASLATAGAVAGAGVVVSSVADPDSCSSAARASARFGPTDGSLLVAGGAGVLSGAGGAVWAGVGSGAAGVGSSTFMSSGFTASVLAGSTIGGKPAEAASSVVGGAAATVLESVAGGWLVELVASSDGVARGGVWGWNCAGSGAGMTGCGTLGAGVAGADGVSAAGGAWTSPGLGSPTTLISGLAIVSTVGVGAGVAGSATATGARDSVLACGAAGAGVTVGVSVLAVLSLGASPRTS